MRPRSILWISPIRPGPAMHGNMAYQNGIVNLFIQHGYSVDYIYYGGWPAPPVNELPFRKLWQVMDEPRFDTWEPKGIDEWVTEDLANFVKRIGARHEYEMVVVDYVWLSRVLTFDCFANCKKIIIGHDVFTDRREVFTRLGKKPLWFHTSRSEEARGINRADLIVAITEADRKFYNEIAPNVNSVTWFNFEICGLPQLISKNYMTLGYMASDNPINIYAIKRFFTCLSNELSDFTNMKIVVAGNICKKFGSYPKVWIEKYGWVENQGDFFNKCDVMILPMPESTGLKIKSLDALAYGKPFFSTIDVGSGLNSSSPWHNYKNIEAMAHDIARLDKAGELWSAARSSLNATAELSQALFKTSRQGKKILSAAIFGDSVQKKPYVSVSVIISVYNGEKTIERCLDSILEDPLEAKEIIVVDDASTDNTLEALKKYRDRITIIRNEKNMGQGPGRNRGLEIANGEFIYFVDADDEIDDNALMKLYAKAVGEKLDVCLIDLPQYKLRPLKYLPAFPAWGGLFRTSLITAHELRQPDLRSGQDGVFSNMLLACSQKTAICEGLSYKYHPSTTGTFLRYLSNPALLPPLIERQLSILGRWYRETGAKPERFLFFIYDETYGSRFTRTMSLLNDAHSRKLYAMIKGTYISLKKKCAKDALTYLDTQFQEIETLDYDSWMEKWVKTGDYS